MDNEQWIMDNVNRVMGDFGAKKRFYTEGSSFFSKKDFENANIKNPEFSALENSGF
jgi:hypothetical protein